MSIAERTCRTCGKASEPNDDQNLFSLFEYPSTKNYEVELKVILEEFNIWNLNIAQNDGLPQKICITCFDSFCQVHNFRILCVEAQNNFTEMCTGLDIFIKNDDIPSDEDIEDNFQVQEYFTFPGDESLKSSTKNIQPDPDVSQTEDIAIKPDPIPLENGELTPKDDPISLKKFRCEYCLNIVSFDDPDKLNDHYNKFHLSDTPYPCPKCPKQFNRKIKQKIHARSHYHEEFECAKCKKKIKGDKTVQWEHDEYYHVVKDRECPICGKLFPNCSMKRLQYHMCWHDDSKLHKCSFCDKKFIQTTHLHCHEQVHVGEFKFKCEKCNSAFKNVHLLGKHICADAHKEPIQCPECPKKLATRKSLHAHMQHHKPDHMYPHCAICKKTYRSMTTFRVHNHKHHGAPATPAILNVMKKHVKDKVVKPYKCSKCPEAFVLHLQLVKHLKTHYEDRPFKCTLCAKSFKRLTHLKFHIDSLHMNKRKHKCTECGWAFSQVTNLKEHIAAKHGGKKEFHCEVCQHDFATRKGLRTHMIKHSDEKPYICSVCSRGFKRLCALEEHMVRHLAKKKDITEITVKAEKVQGNTDEE